MIIPCVETGSDEYWVKLNCFGIVPDRYIISNYGNIYDLVKQHFVVPNIYSHVPYIIVTLYVSDTKSKQFFLHRLVCMAFYPNEDMSLVVNHIDGIKRNNKSLNLEWVTRKENDQHALKMGLKKCRGEDNTTSKLKNNQVHQICKLMENNDMTYSDILRNVGLENSKQNLDILAKIRSKHLWSHISNQYAIPDKEYRSKIVSYSNEQIDYICQLIQNGLTNKDIAINIGIDVSNYKEYDKFRHFVSRIRDRKTYTEISNKYNW